MHIPARRSRWSPSALRMSPLAWREARWGYIFILPWNFKDEILAQLAHARAWGAKFIVGIPAATIL